MNIGIIGSGGREHALSFKLKQSEIVDKIYCIPGNAGTKLIAENISIQINDFEKIKKRNFKQSCCGLGRGSFFQKNVALVRVW